MIQKLVKTIHAHSARWLPVLIFISLPSCFLMPKQTTPARTLKPAQQQGDVFSEGLFEIERSEDNTGAIIRFETLFTASCRIAFFPTESPPSEAAKYAWADCASPQPGRKFSESIKGLETTKLYTVAIKLWSIEQTADQGIMYRVNEQTSGDSIFRVDIKTLSGMLESLNFVRPPSEQVKLMVSPDPCKFFDKPETRPSPGELNDGHKIGRLSSRGFLTGATGVAPAGAGLRSFKGSSLQAASTEWVLNIQSKGSSGSLRVKRPAAINSVTLTQGGNSLEMVDSLLDDSDTAAFVLSKSIDLSVKWSLDGAPDNGVLILAIKSHVSSGSLECRLSATEKSATISAANLGKFAAGRGALSFAVETVQGFELKRWIIRATDWRSQPIRF